ncbi:hypothetical protein D3C71_1777420 [compost metagenome]
MVVPVAKRSEVAHAMMASATSCAWPIRRSGVVLAARSLKLLSRPGTKPVSTTPGETLSTRMAGANARPSDIAMTSSPAFTAQYATLLPCPVRPAMDPTLTTRPSPLARSNGANARIAANWPRQLMANISSIRASSRASRSPCGIARVKPDVLTRISARP